MRLHWRGRKGALAITHTFVFLFSKFTGVWFVLCLPRKPRPVSWRGCWERSDTRGCGRSRAPQRDCSGSISHWCTCRRTRYSLMDLLFLETGIVELISEGHFCHRLFLSSHLLWCYSLKKPQIITITTSTASQFQQRRYITVIYFFSWICK